MANVQAQEMQDERSGVGELVVEPSARHDELLRGVRNPLLLRGELDPDVLNFEDGLRQLAALIDHGLVLVV
eukprot:CAMPEP_0183395712 /NCGR_PEP_ID=MMETSP0370-20130417/9519_1 /TAXON_ID=268820 /ORGANISM="Peridinium aciculiferum, Strain PAER-2" /LENGTH=70 /DNA_ID=CAMNT_0025576383 /DNA_START=463 /DNA_END=676 /DNA_ORIENTATION=-